MAEDEALFRKGMPIRRDVLGPEYVDASMARADEFMMSFQRATTAWAWGWAWGDPTLDRKTRSLMNLAMLTALNRAPEIKLHVKGALNNSVTVEEIKAALLHAIRVLTTTPQRGSSRAARAKSVVPISSSY
jgi:4-carboxymuconolactone decarboxylase